MGSQGDRYAGPGCMSAQGNHTGGFESWKGLQLQVGAQRVGGAGAVANGQPFVWEVLFRIL